jgi:membrane protein
MTTDLLDLPRLCLRVVIDAYNHFNSADGWAIASHIALSILLALFPFLILVTSLAASLFGSTALADEVAQLLLDTWPDAVAAPIAQEIRTVLTTSRTDLLTISVALAIFFASSGIESLRIGLNRAYGMGERRSWILLRLESIGYVILGAIAMLAMALLIVLGPLLFTAASRLIPSLLQFEWNITIARYAVATAVLIVALIVAHKWLAAGHRKLSEIAPGIIATLMLWLVGGMVFGRYLAEFPSVYVSYYAGLASGMIALVFLYLTASIFVFGGELNAAIVRARSAAYVNSSPEPAQ